MNKTMTIFLLILVTFFFAYLLKTTNTSNTQQNLNTSLINDFGSCGVESRPSKCWAAAFKKFIHSSQDLSDDMKIITQKMSQLTCESEQFRNSLEHHDMKRKCHSTMGSVFHGFLKNPNAALNLCDSIPSEFTSSAKFCASGYYKQYYLAHPEPLFENTPLNIAICQGNKKHFTNCLKAQMSSFKNNWPLFEKKINFYCSLGDQLSEYCYVAFGATVMSDKFIAAEKKDFKSLCKTPRPEYKKFCIKGMLNTFLIETYDFQKGKNYCQTVNNKSDFNFCRSFVDKDFLAGR